MRRLLLPVLVLVLVVPTVGSAAAAPTGGVAASVAQQGHDHRDHDHGPTPAELPAPDAARGIVTAGLAVATDGPCVGLLEVVDAPGRVCTHGPDAAPPTVGDVRFAASTAPASATTAGAAPAFTCDGDGVSGRRAHAIYAVPPDRIDRFATFEATFKSLIARAQDEYRQSSILHGADEALVFRFTHTTPVDGQCEPVLDHVRLPDAADDDSFGATITALQELGYTDPSRRYLVFMDSNVMCGIGQLYLDDRADPSSNYNNLERQPLFSRVDAGCWGYAETHELSHNIGAVQDSAPHATGAGHCNDDHDMMCYADGGPLSSLYVSAQCGLASLWEKRLDCGGDDYFNPSPEPGSYLDTHWNIADSGWLFTEPLTSTDGGTASTDDGSVTTDDDASTSTDGTTATPTPSTPPTVSIAAPSSGVTDRKLRFSGSSADDDGDLAEVRLFVDGRKVGSVAVGSLPAGGGWSEHVTVEPGDRVLAAQAVDELGNTSARAEVAITALHDLPLTDLFEDDHDSHFEAAIERLAVQGVTRGCNPPANDRFCPEDPVTRGQMAAFLARALALPAASGVEFVDDDDSVFEGTIERLAAAGITRGCNPPANDRFCPDDPVTRGQMAAFLARALYS